MFEINFYIPEKTISLENSRDLETMYLDDIIYWCFFTQIDFIVSKQSLLFLPEISLFQFVDGFANSLKQISSQIDSRTVIEDRYGSFELYIEQSKGLVNIREGYVAKTKFQIATKDFTQGATNFVKSVINQAKYLFPGLNSNESYQKVSKDWQSIIS